MNRWLVVLGAVIIQVCLGAVYAWSLFNQPLIDKFGWEKEGVVLTFSITIATMASFTIVAGKIQDKIGPRWVATAGGILLGAGLLISSKVSTLTELYLFYGFIGGAGIGAAYVTPLATCIKWFPDKRGFISGIAVAGFGGGGLLFKPVITSFLASHGVSATFMYLGIIYSLAIIAGAQLLRLPPVGYVPAGWSPPPAAKNSSQQFTTGQMLSTVQFYLLWVMYLFGCISGLMVISFAANIGISLVKLDPAVAAGSVAVIALFNAAGRVAWGTLSDKLGRTKALVMMYGLTAGIMLFMGMFDMNYTTFLISVSLVGFCFGGFLALFPSITADYYGTQNLGINYGIVYLAYGTAAFAGPMIATAMEFNQAFIIASVLCAIAGGLTFLIKPPALPERGYKPVLGEK